MLQGAVYGQELDYVFGLPISCVWPHVTWRYTRAEAVLSALVISYWANFVKDGSVPTPLFHIHNSHNSRNKSTCHTLEIRIDFQTREIKLDDFILFSDLCFECNFY